MSDQLGSPRSEATAQTPWQSGTCSAGLMVRFLPSEWPAVVCVHFHFWLWWRCNHGTSCSSLVCFGVARGAGGLWITCVTYLQNRHSQPLKAELRGASQYPRLLFPAALTQSSPEGLCIQCWEGSYMSWVGWLSASPVRRQGLHPGSEAASSPCATTFQCN